MAEEKKEAWLSYVALCTVILAVCATLSTFKGGGYSTKSVISQSQAANQWAYYQAKDIKSYMYELQKERLELDVERQSERMKAEDLAAYKDRIAKYEEKIKKYDAQKAKIEQDARAFESVIVDAQKHSQSFGLAVIFLQIAILMSSISALMKIKKVWFAGLAIGSLGLVYFANGFFLFLS